MYVRSLPWITTWAGLALAGFAGLAAADVTIEEKATIEAAIFKAHTTSTENYAEGKKRHDTEMRCDGMMSMICGKTGGGEIVRLDTGLTYELEPAKKRYREVPLPTEAERKEAQRRLAENMEKIKQCAAQQPAAVDTSKCQMSPPKVDVKNLGPAGQLLGHDVHRSVVTMTTSCTNKETKDVCDMQFGFDVLLTNDKIQGLEDRDTFTKAYLQKMGLSANDPIMAQQVQTALAPYAEQMKQLRAKSGDLKGQPLRTTFRVAFGGASCASAKGGTTAGAAGTPGGSADLGSATRDAVAQSTADVAASKAADGSVGGTIASRALSSVGGKFLSGMFKKKKAETTEASPTAPAEEALAPNMVSLVTFTTETTAVTPGPVPAERFEVPAGWKKREYKPGTEEPFTCPSNSKGK